MLRTQQTKNLLLNSIKESESKRIAYTYKVSILAQKLDPQFHLCYNNKRKYIFYGKETLTTVPNSNNQFRLNVGFLLNAPVGDSRDFLFDVPSVHLDPDLDLQDLSGSARVSRTAQGLLVQARLKAALPAECVRCLSGFNQQLEADFTELYAFSPDSVTDSGLLLPENAHIDLSPLIREHMLLAIPISPLCSPDCKGLCPVCGSNLNEAAHEHEAEDIDPRLEVLRSLKKEQKKQA